jgi:hypothetical protein
MASTPKKEKKSEARTDQTGIIPQLGYVGKQYITPKKGDEDDYDEENVQTVDIPTPTKEQLKKEAEVASRQEEVRRAILTAKGGKKKRRSMKKTRKVKKVKKVRKH